jgi:hypothetical protein
MKKKTKKNYKFGDALKAASPLFHAKYGKKGKYDKKGGSNGNPNPTDDETGAHVIEERKEGKGTVTVTGQTVGEVGTGTNVPGEGIVGAVTGAVTRAVTDVKDVTDVTEEEGEGDTTKVEEVGTEERNTGGKKAKKSAKKGKKSAKKGGKKARKSAKKSRR